MTDKTKQFVLAAIVFLLLTIVALRSPHDVDTTPGNDARNTTVEVQKTVPPVADVPQAAVPGPPVASPAPQVGITGVPSARPPVTAPAPVDLRDIPPSAAKDAKTDLLAGNSDLHVISVYEGQYPGGITHTFSSHPEGAVSVTVNRKGRPVALWLSSYEPVMWNVSAARGVVLAKVIATGYYRQTVNGLPAGVPLYLSGYDDSVAYYNNPRNRDQALDAIEKVMMVTRKKPTSLQGAYSGNGFVIDAASTLPSTAVKSEPAANAGPVVFRLHPVPSLGGRLSADQLTAGYCCAGASSSVRATRGYVSGKFYFEMQLKVREGASAPDTWTDAGLLSAAEHANFVGPAGGDYGYSYGVVRRENARYKDGDVFGIAADLDRGRMHFHINGEWVVGPPDAGGIELRKGREYFAGVTVSASSSNPARSTDAWTANFGASPFKYAVPPGFIAYDGGENVGQFSDGVTHGRSQ